MKNYILIGIVVLAIIGFSMFFANNSSVLTEINSDTTASINVVTTLSPEQPQAGEPTEINFSFTDGEGSPLTNLMTHHARRVHVVLVSENLNSIAHIHPADFSAITNAVVESENYSVTHTFPQAGKYIVGIDVMNEDGTAGKQFIINVKGSPKIKSAVTSDFRNEKCFVGHPEDGGTDRYVDTVFSAGAETTCPEGYQVTFSTSVETVVAGENVRLEYHFEKDGVPIQNMEPFLDAPLHLAIVPESLETLLHRHGEVASMDHHDEDSEQHESSMETEGMDAMGAMDHHGSIPESFGPDLVSEGIIFPVAGLYQVFAQAKHDGNIVFSSFMVEVLPGFDIEDATTFDLAVLERGLSTEVVTVTEGDQVVFYVSSDEIGEFHIAGYEIEKEIHTEEASEIRFTANKAGKYNLELHPGGSDDDIVIGALVVNPK